MQFGSRQWQTLALIAMALFGVGFGIWLLRKGFAALGGLFVGLFLWRVQQFVVWFIAPARAPSDVTPPLTSRWQPLLLSIVCLLGAAVCAVGVYLSICGSGGQKNGKQVLFSFSSACLYWHR